MQRQINTLSRNVERLIEQIRLSDQQRFGRQTEKLDQIAGQLSFFNETRANCDEDAPNPGIEETVATASKPSKTPKEKGQRKEDMGNYPQEEILHSVPKARLNGTSVRDAIKTYRTSSAGC